MKRDPGKTPTRAIQFSFFFFVLVVVQKSHLKSAMKKLALYLKKTMDAKLPVPALAVPVKAVPRVEKPVVGQAVTSADTKQASSLEVCTSTPSQSGV